MERIGTFSVLERVEVNPCPADSDADFDLWGGKEFDEYDSSDDLFRSPLRGCHIQVQRRS